MAKIIPFKSMDQLIGEKIMAANKISHLIGVTNIFNTITTNMILRIEAEIEIEGEK